MDIFNIIMKLIFSYLGCNMLLLIITFWQLKMIYKHKGKTEFLKYCSPSKYENRLFYKIWVKIIELVFFPSFYIVKIFDYFYKEKAFDEVV